MRALIVLLACLTSLAMTMPASAAPNGSLKAVALTCERVANPLGIDARQPRLSWKLTAGRRAERQTAYQVLAASSRDALRQDRGDVWDSGRVESDQQLGVVYGGRALRSGERVWWKVRVWDRDGRPSGWSAPAWWEIGLLESGDWHGQWIGRTTDTVYQPAPLLRREFTLDAKPKRARLYICGLGYYEARLNGAKLGDRVLDPGYTRYDRRDLYATYDVTDALRRGPNALGVMLGTGWYNVHTRAVWYFDKAPWRAAPKLLAELVVEYPDGRAQIVATDTRWKTSTGPITFDSIYGGETYDARLEKAGWDRPGYDDAGWQAALAVPPPGGVLAAQVNPPIRVTKTLAPVRLTEPQPGVYVYDFGQNLAGHAQLSVDVPAGTRIQMRYGERLKPDGTLETKQIDVFVKQEDPKQQFQTDTYVAKGAKGGGPETWETRFAYDGFQYVEMTGYPPSRQPTLDTLRARFAHTDVPPVGEFACSNDLLNRIQEATRWSYLSNLQSIPTDCPTREKNGWTGDAQLAAEQGLLNYDGAAVYVKWMNDLGDEQRPTGALPGIVPTSGWGYEWGAGPAWDSAFVLIPWYLYEYAGDDRAIEAHYDGMKRYEDYMTTKAKDGIVEFGLGDWVPWKTETPVAVTDTGYYYRDARVVAAAARLLGKEDDARKYDALAEDIRRAFNAKFVDAATGNVAGGSQTALSCALYQGLLDDNVKPKTLARLVANVEQHDGHLDTGILGAKYVLRALTQNGRADLAYRVATQKTQPGWGWWIEQGATTLWETWTGDSSLNHIMFGDISAWFYRALAGIQPDAAGPGFGRFVIRPHVVGDLTWARASHDSPRGRIASDWRRDGNTLHLTVEVPPNAAATVYVPTSDPATVKEGGRAAVRAAGLKGAPAVPGYAVFEVGSGRYEFTSRL